MNRDFLMRRRGLLAIGILAVTLMGTGYGAYLAVQRHNYSETNPLYGATFAYDPTSPAVERLAKGNMSPEVERAAKFIAKTPQARWFGSENSNTQSDLRGFIQTSNTNGQMPIVTLYGIPNRDCGGLSQGGASSAAEYRTWIDKVVLGIGEGTATVIVEPDALAAIDCLSGDSLAERYELLNMAVDRLSQNPGTTLYLDAGNAYWIPASQMADRLKRSGIAQAQGFALNVSNYYTGQESERYGEQLSSLVSGKHYVVDTSRNGIGPDAKNTWCNPAGRKLGPTPEAFKNRGALDAYLWIKNPGTSDGTCNGGPQAGKWWDEAAADLL